MSLAFSSDDNLRYTWRVHIAHTLGEQGIPQDALEAAFALFLDERLDVLVVSAFGQAHSEVNHRHIRGGDPEGHAGQLTLQFRNHLFHTKRSPSDHHVVRRIVLLECYTPDKSMTVYGFT
jgi:hypothetical protein